MNTKEQELFWQAVGFKKRRRKVALAGGMGRYKVARRTVLVSPNGDICGIYGYDDNIGYPKMDANNFFKWVLPKLKEYDWGFSIDTRWQTKDFDWVSDLYKQTWNELK